MKKSLEDIALAKAVLIVKLALRDRFENWRKKAKSNNKVEIFKTMEGTYNLVQEYISGMFKDLLDNQNID